MNTPVLNPKDIESAQVVFWQTGIPDVPRGSSRTFWCACRRRGSEKIFHATLQYLNGLVMPLSDSCDDAPETAVPVGDDGEYAWTGWHENHCEQCETTWTFSGEVIAWMEMPKYQSGEGEK